MKPALKTTNDPESPGDPDDQPRTNPLIAFFTKNRDVTDAWTPPAHGVPNVQTILQSKNLTMGDLMARNEEVLPYKISVTPIYHPG